MQAAALGGVAYGPDGVSVCHHVPCEAQSGFEVEILQSVLVEFQRNHGHLFVQPPQLLVVGLAVDRLFVDEGLHEAPLSLFELVVPALRRGEDLAALPAKLLPEIQEGRFDQAGHRGRHLDRLQQLAEELFQLVGPRVDALAPLIPAPIVAVQGPHLSAAPGSRQGAMAESAVDESPQGKVRVLDPADGRLNLRATGEPCLNELPCFLVDQGRVVTLSFDAPFLGPGHARVERVLEDADEVRVTKLSALSTPQPEGVHLRESVGGWCAGGHRFEGGSKERS